MKKGHIAEEAIESLLAIVCAGPTQRGKIQKRKGKAPLKGKLKKWCPVPGCKRMVLDIGRHLINPKFHNFKNGTQEYQRYVRMARRYTGFAELEDKLIPPPPPIVELNPEEDPYQEDPNQEDPNEEDPNQEDPHLEDPNQEDHDQQRDDKEDPEEESEEENYSDEYQEDEDYASQSKLSRNEFFTAAKPTNNRHRWLVKFF